VAKQDHARRATRLDSFPLRCDPNSRRFVVDSGSSANETIRNPPALRDWADLYRVSVGCLVDRSVQRAGRRANKRPVPSDHNWTIDEECHWRHRASHQDDFGGIVCRGELWRMMTASATEKTTVHSAVAAAMGSIAERKHGVGAWRAVCSRSGLRQRRNGISIQLNDARRSGLMFRAVRSYNVVMEWKSRRRRRITTQRNVLRTLTKEHFDDDCSAGNAKSPYAEVRMSADKGKRGERGEGKEGKLSEGSVLPSANKEETKKCFVHCQVCSTLTDLVKCATYVTDAEFPDRVLVGTLPRSVCGGIQPSV